MKYEERWKKDKKLGQGGQAEVFLVLERQADGVSLIDEICDSIAKANATSSYDDSRVRAKTMLQQALARFVEGQSQMRLGALKVLHTPENARDPNLARKRASREIAAMPRWTHPSLLRLFDSDPEELWYVSEYHDRGTLDKQLLEYAGDLRKVARAIRPLVEAVSMLHRDRVVHRDIKPQNIFVGTNGELILGDFGLVCELDNARISETHANVGTRAWMPGWALETRVDELTPAFDVFALGKLMWTMLSGKPVLQLWYYNRPNNDVACLFPGRPEMAQANRLFSKCVVEEEADCLPTADDLLLEIDDLLAQLDLGTSLINAPKRICKVCHDGQYTLVDRHRERQFGVAPGENFVVRLLGCDNCGHVQLFFFDSSSPPHLWKEGEPFHFQSANP